MVEMKRSFEKSTGLSLPLVEPPASRRQTRADEWVSPKTAGD
jgi:hypothetical protein